MRNPHMLVYIEEEYSKDMKIFKLKNNVMQIYSCILNDVGVFMLNWKKKYTVWDNKIKLFSGQCNGCGFDLKEILVLAIKGRLA